MPTRSTYRVTHEMLESFLDDVNEGKQVHINTSPARRDKMSAVIQRLAQSHALKLQARQQAANLEVLDIARPVEPLGQPPAASVTPKRPSTDTITSRSARPPFKIERVLSVDNVMQLNVASSGSSSAPDAPQAKTRKDKVSAMIQSLTDTHSAERQTRQQGAKLELLDIRHPSDPDSVAPPPASCFAPVCPPAHVVP